MTLPIAPLLPEAVSALRQHAALVVEAPPGAGKTTALPPALLAAFPGEVVVLEPRRLAARLAARRVADELGEEVGRTVGWKVRFEDVGGPTTRLRYVTEAVLVRRMLSEPMLPGVAAVVLDEFHERHLHGDLALALARRLMPRLKVVVMSATLAAEPVLAYLGGAARVRSEGRAFPVAIEHAADADVASAIRRLMPLDGDVLVFLPGAAEIARARAACATLGVDLAQLHGDLPAAEQDRAVRPGPRPKVILSTNVAESSVTIPGVVAVVDSGLARVASHSPWTGLPTLRVAKISQASAAQRAGRAGRTRAGRCLRLYSRHDLETRPAADVAEVRRADLAEAALLLHAAGVPDLAAFPWLEPPSADAVEAAEALLARLGAVREGALTDVGRRLLAYPLHPRLGRLMLDAEARGVADEAALACALLGERPIEGGAVDLLERMEQARGDPAVERARKQIARTIRRGPRSKDPDGDLRQAILAAFPDRVARRRGREVVLSGGGSAELAGDAAWVVAVEAEERRTGASRRVLVRTASRIEPDWLLDGVTEERELGWNDRAGRVEVVARLRYDQLVLDESRGPPGPGDAAAASQLLLRAARARPVEPAVERWLARVRFVARHAPALTPPDVDAVLAELCRGASALDELGGLLDALRARLTPAQHRLVAEMAPERIALPGGRAPVVDYADAPAITSRLQDFFGLTRTPTVAGGRVPLVLHLTAPSGRDVQVTSDLDGFWSRHYPAVRRELMRRYPKHKWPEDPRQP
jgi:ATP-dependent helicase HrpB